MPRKCKKGEVFDIKIKACRKSTRKDRYEQLSEKDAYNPAKSYGTSRGLMASSLAGVAVEQAGVKMKTSSKLALLAAGALYGRRKAIKMQKKRDKELGIKKAPSRKIPKKYRKK